MKTKTFAPIFLLIILSLSACVSTTQTNLEKASAINVSLGLGYLKEDQTVRAKTKLLLAEKQDPYSVKPLLALAYYQQQQGNLRRAGKYYERALMLQSKNASALNNYAILLCREKKFNHAKELFISAEKYSAGLELKEIERNKHFCLKQMTAL